MALFMFSFVCNARSLDHQFFLFFLCKVSHPNVRIVMDPSFWKKLQIGLACPKVRFLEFWKKSYSFRYTSSLQYRSAKKKYFFWRFTKTACLQKMWFLSYGPKTSNQNAGFFKLQYLTKNLRYETQF